MKKLVMCMILFISLFAITNNVSEAATVANLKNEDISAAVVNNVVTLKFKSKLTKATATSKNIIVTDANNKSVPGVNVKLSSTQKEVTLGNVKNYTQGETYYLTIKKNLASTSGAKMKNDAKFSFIINKGKITLTDITPISKTINNVTIRIDKVVQDSDSLKIYVTYINKSKEEVLTLDSLARIVANGKQYEYDSDFNFNRWYEKNVPHAADLIEVGVTEQSVIFFKPVNASKINVVLNADFEDYRFNNVNIQKQ